MGILSRFKKKKGKWMKQSTYSSPKEARGAVRAWRKNSPRSIAYKVTGRTIYMKYRK